MESRAGGLPPLAAAALQTLGRRDSSPELQAEQPPGPTLPERAEPWELWDATASSSH